jgi:hypothetical protein
MLVYFILLIIYIKGVFEHHNYIFLDIKANKLF